MARFSAMSLVAGGLMVAGIVGAWKRLTRVRALDPSTADSGVGAPTVIASTTASITVTAASTAARSATDPLMASPLYADPGQRPLVDEPPIDDDYLATELAFPAQQSGSREPGKPNPRARSNRQVEGDGDRDVHPDGPAGEGISDALPAGLA